MSYERFDYCPQTSTHHKLNTRKIYLNNIELTMHCIEITLNGRRINAAKNAGLGRYFTYKDNSRACAWSASTIHSIKRRGILTSNVTKQGELSSHRHHSCYCCPDNPAVGAAPDVTGFINIRHSPRHVNNIIFAEAA
jgi:hypothetical protein